MSEENESVDLSYVGLRDLILELLKPFIDKKLTPERMRSIRNDLYRNTRKHKENDDDNHTR